MRDFVVVFVVLVLIFGGGWILNKYIESSANELLNKLDNLDYTFALSSAEKEIIIKDLRGFWEKTESFWIIFEYHDCINDIEDLLVETYTFYLEDDKVEFLASSRKLRRMVDDLKNRGGLTYVNIF